MLELIKELEDVMVSERARAVEQGHAEVFNSNHEAYAVILEEYQEANHEAVHFFHTLEEAWRGSIRRDEEAYEQFIKMRDVALRCCAEWLQVASMCQKSADSEVLR